MGNAEDYRPEVVHMRDAVMLRAVKVDRGSDWGNPFIMRGEGDRNRVCNLFDQYAQWRLTVEPDWLKPLRGKDLACWCAPKRCHADTLLKLSNMVPPMTAGQRWGEEKDYQAALQVADEARKHAQAIGSELVQDKRDLQAQVEKWQDIAGLRFAGDHKFVKEMELLKVENAALQQRVAQLEGQNEVLSHKQDKMFEYQCPKAPPSCLMCGKVEEFAIKHLEFGSVGICKPCVDLQADHARVLGLVQEIKEAFERDVHQCERCGEADPLTTFDIYRTVCEAATLPAQKSVPANGETLISVTTWANETFGPATIRVQIDRAKKEFIELVQLQEVDHDHAQLAEEAADVVICLYRVIGTLDPEAINKKMAKNRARKWNVDGQGCAQHVGEE